MTVADGSARYTAKREAGLPASRRDGSAYSAETDRQAAAAEKFAAELLGCPYNSAVYATHGDGGADFVYPLRVEVYHPQHERPGHLIVPADEPHRWADVYVVVLGTIETGFWIRGWTTHWALVAQPQKDFGYGPRLAMHFSKLYDIASLQNLRMTSSPD